MIIARLRAYEKGEYGLEAAVDEVKNTKRTLKLRENRIEELTQTCNNLQFQTSRFHSILVNIIPILEVSKYSPEKLYLLIQSCTLIISGEILEENAAMREKLGISPRQRDTSSGKPPALTKQQAAEKKQQETRALMQVFFNSFNKLSFK